MLQESLYPPTFRMRLDNKLRRIWSRGLKKITPKPPQPAGRFVNSVAWCIHGDIATRVVFYNYFWRNHHEEAIKLDVQLFNAEGRELWRDSKLVLQDQTLAIDSADIARAIGQERFEGYLAFSSTLAKVPEYIELIRYNVDYYTADGGMSTVHDQAIFWPSFPRDAHSLGKMEVVETDEIGTALIFVNSLAFDSMSITVDVDVRRHDGAAIRVGSYSLAAKAMARIELSKDQPELVRFLEGRSGQVIVESDFYIKRAAVMQYSKQQPSRWYSVNHSEEYRGKPPYLERPLAEPALDKTGPMAPVPFFHNHRGVTTELVLFHDIPGAGAQQTYGVTLFDQHGNQILVHDHVLTVPLHGTGRVSLRDLLPAEQTVFGFAQVFLSAAPHNAHWAASFPVDVHYIVDQGKWDAMYSQGSYRSANAGEGTRTRVFSRIYCDQQSQTDLVFFHPCTAVDPAKRIPQSSTQVTLCDPSGKFVITRELRLKPFATALINVAELFPEIKTFGLRPGIACGVYVRDVKAKILVVHVTRHAASGSIAVDHFFGG